MKSKTLKITGMLTTAIAALLVLAGCTINIGTGSNGTNSMMDGSNSNGMMGGNRSTAAGSLSSADIMFAEMMIPHHQQAVDMGTLAETRASDPKVKALAAKIKAA